MPSSAPTTNENENILDDIYDDDDDDGLAGGPGGDYIDADRGGGTATGGLRDQGKTKRAQVGRPPASDSAHHDPSAYRPAPSSVTSSSGLPAAANGTVAFRAHVQHRITAYVTWPMTSSSSSCVQAASSSPSVAGYIFRYRAVDDDADTGGGATGDDSGYIVRNLAANFVVLDNLVPNARYLYQVRYVFDNASPSAWSQQALLDTSYNLQNVQQTT